MNIQDLVDMMDIKNTSLSDKMVSQICHPFCQNKSYAKKCNSIIFLIRSFDLQITVG